MTGLYIHVPFCSSRCIYCDFFSTTLLERREEYVETLCREIALRRTDDPIPTIYFGGGTPSMLSGGQIARILDCIDSHYNVLPGAEVTLEANPDDITAGNLLATISGRQDGTLSVNRLSMGVQSFDDQRLRLLRRRHTAQQAIDAIAAAHRCGIHNISIDLIYGLPGQTMDEWRQDVHTALAQPVTHLSAYALSYEPHTALYMMRERGEVAEASDELSRAMYYHLTDECERAGFCHYEISNFATPQHHSRHNSSYWCGTPYIGFGPGAHSYDGQRTRSSNACDIDAWAKGVGSSYTAASIETLTDEVLFNERLFLSLRTMQGLDTDALRRHHPTLYRRMSGTLDRYIQQGQLIYNRPWVRLAREAIFTSDDIISDLFC